MHGDETTGEIMRFEQGLKFYTVIRPITGILSVETRLRIHGSETGNASARPCVPLDMFTFAVPMKKFTRMVKDMDESFLTTPAWEKVQKKIIQSQKRYTSVK